MQAAAQAAAQAAQEGAQTLLTKEVYRPGEAGAGPSSGASPAGDAAEKPKFMKLPIQAAYRLKWYDSGKVADLIEQHLEEQRAVLGENKRLRGMLRARGALPEELERKAGAGPAAQEAADATAQVLALAARNEISGLRKALKSSEAEVKRLSLRLEASEASGSEEPGVTLDVEVDESDPSNPGVSLRVGVAGEAKETSAPAGARPSEGGDEEPRGTAASEVTAGAPSQESAALRRHVELLEASLAEANAKLAEAQESYAQELGGVKKAALRAETEAKRREVDLREQVEGLRKDLSQGESQAGQSLQAAQDAAATAERQAVELAGQKSALSMRLKELEEMVKTQVASLAEAKAGARAATARARQLEDEILRADGAKAAQKRDAKASIEEIRSQKERTESELRRQCGELEAQLRDSRAQAREGREKEEASQARLATLDGLQQERAKLVSSVEQLEAKLAEARAENAQVEPLKAALNEMEESKAKLEAEVLGTAQLVTEAELKLQTREQEFLASQEEISEIERNMGKLRKQVELEFERKLESLAADPSQWPEAMRRAVGDFERRLEEALMNLRRREEDLEDAVRQRDRARDENTDVLRRCSRMESELAASSGAGEARLQSLTNQVKDLQEERDAAEKARQEKEEEVILLKVARDKEANKIEGVDLVYLKNVLIKFLEVAFKPDMHQECMALLPAIGTLVGMGKEEFGRVQAAMQTHQSAASASGSSATSQVWAQFPSSLQLNMPKFS